MNKNNTRKRGTVTRFIRFLGFIKGDDDKEIYFVNQSEIRTRGWWTRGLQTLEAHDIVTFTPVITEDGRKLATDIRVILQYKNVRETMANYKLRLREFLDEHGNTLWHVVDEYDVIQHGGRGMNLKEIAALYNVSYFPDWDCIYYEKYYSLGADDLKEAMKLFGGLSAAPEKPHCESANTKKNCLRINIQNIANDHYYYESAQYADLFYFAQRRIMEITELTPAEMMDMFPISQTEWMSFGKILERLEIGPDDPIGFGKIVSFLCSYPNDEIRRFILHYFWVLDNYCFYYRKRKNVLDIMFSDDSKTDSGDDDEEDDEE